MLQVVMDIPMPGHPHQSAEVLRANIAPWHAETQLPWRSDFQVKRFTTLKCGAIKVFRKHRPRV